MFSHLKYGDDVIEIMLGGFHIYNKRPEAIQPKNSRRKHSAFYALRRLFTKHPYGGQARFIVPLYPIRNVINEILDPSRSL
jgi:hypothetical protein